MTVPIDWTPEVMDEAREVLRRHEKSRDAASELSQRWGRSVSSERLARAFLRRNESIRNYLGGGPVTPNSQSGNDLSQGGSEAAIFPTGEPAPESTADPHLEVVRVVQGGASTLEAVCDRLRCPPSEARTRVLEARAAGYDLSLTDTTIAFQAADEPAEVHAVERAPATEKDPVFFAAISDTHFGAAEMAGGQFQEFVEEAHSRGVRHVLHAGDIFEGTYHRGHQYEVAEVGFERQCAAGLSVLPELPGLHYYLITGNHDWNCYHKAVGMDPGRAFEARARQAGREDVHHLGHQQGRVQLGDVRIELAHPSGGSAYAKSYPVQKWIERYEGGDKPHILIFGHYHSYMVIENRNVCAIMPGCWKFQGTFEQSKGLQPAVGGALIWAWRDEVGMRFRHEWRRWWPTGVTWQKVA